MNGSLMNKLFGMEVKVVPSGVVPEGEIWIMARNIKLEDKLKLVEELVAELNKEVDGRVVNVAKEDSPYDAWQPASSGGVVKHIFKHIVCDGAGYHVLSWDSYGERCSEPNCEVNVDYERRKEERQFKSAICRDVIQRYEGSRAMAVENFTSTDSPTEQDLKDWLLKIGLWSKEEQEEIQEYAVNNKAYFRIDPSKYG